MENSFFLFFKPCDAYALNSSKGSGVWRGLQNGGGGGAQVMFYHSKNAGGGGFSHAEGGGGRHNKVLR